MEEFPEESFSLEEDRRVLGEDILNLPSCLIDLFGGLDSSDELAEEDRDRSGEEGGDGEPAKDLDEFESSEDEPLITT